jgi:hypothetical protein
MYSRLFRSASGFAIRPNTRAYATRRVINRSQSAPLPPSARQFQSIGQLQGQPALAQASDYYEELNEGGDIQATLSTPTLPHLPKSTEAPISEHHDSETRLEDGQFTATSMDGEALAKKAATPLYFQGSKFVREPYWQKIGRWQNVTEKEFLTHSWQVSL